MAGVICKVNCAAYVKQNLSLYDYLFYPPSLCITIMNYINEPLSKNRFDTDLTIPKWRHIFHYERFLPRPHS